MEKRIKELIVLLNKASESYYNLGISEMSDKEYDTLYAELVDLENKTGINYPDSPTNKVGFIPKSTFKKVKHDIPMLSLNNSYSKDDMETFVRSIKKVKPKAEFTVEFKYDGVSISLDYENSVLKRALTRGNGVIGEDITENVKMISDIPHRLNSETPLNITVRGEILLSKCSFAELNEKKREEGEELFKNTRNTVAGTLRLHDPLEVRKRNLESRMYYLISDDSTEDQQTAIETLRDLGFNAGINVYSRLFTVDEVMNAIDNIEKEKSKLGVDVDGAVIKVSQKEYWEEIGYTSKAPKYAIAYKFDTEKATARLNEVVWQVGRTGKLTPVAVFDTVSLAGTLVSKSTLHNMNQIKEKGLKLYDIIVVEKAAEIIPQIIGPVKNMRNGKEKEIVAPTNCPTCGSELYTEEGKVDLRCGNWNCLSRLASRIEHYISRDAVNIMHMGPSLIEELMAKGVLTGITDIYKLPALYKDTLFPLERKVAESVTKSLNADPVGLLYGLGIPGVGRTNARKLIDKFCSIENILFNDKIESLVEVLGPVVANNVSIFGSLESTAILMDELRKYGVRTERESCAHNINGKFNGKFFVLTGKMTHYLNKREIINIIETEGGMVLNGINKSVDYLVVGEEAGSKLSKAKEMGITCITEKEFKELLNN